MPPPRLLFDENLSDRLPRLVADVYPGSCHVTDLRLQGADDEDIWTRARDEGLVLVTKDEDFQRLSVLRGSPPKILWICLGNCSTLEVAVLLKESLEVVNSFVDHTEAAFLALGSGNRRGVAPVR